MKVFSDYSRYYTLLYRDKDYEKEVNYIEDLIHEYSPVFESVLDLGCGAGRHARLLADKGYLVYGVDLSEDMIALAKQNTGGERGELLTGDIRTVCLGKEFDVVLSLFHVLGYQNSNEDVRDTFLTAFKHLKKDGIFLFDCWYGPAVLTDRPSVRIKRLEDESIEVIRLAEPVLHANRNTVDVNYTLFIRDKVSGKLDEIRETHCMRYFFKPEIEFFLLQTGFKLEGFSEYLTGEELGFNTWNACFVGRKK